MEWFNKAKLGIFMHWGIYAVKGVGESWSFYKGEVPYDEYMDQLNGFTAANYDPEKWAELFKKCGAKYAVLTSKHHDGVALWDTKASHLNVVEKTPAKRDLIAPYCEAMRNAGIKVGLYFSHLDWNHKDYAAIHPHSDEWWATNKYTSPAENEPDDLEKWERFLKFHKEQLTELLTKFGKIDLLWFDGTWERTEEQWKFKEMREYIKKLSPDTIVNERIGSYGDYKCPEQGVPTVAPDGPWELCITLNDSWGYVENDNNYKSLRQIVRIFTECISGGGNMLLDIGPKADGTIDERDEKCLLQLGEWIEPVKEAIYDTKRGLPAGHFLGSSTISEDNKNVYLFYYDLPIDEICVKGIRNDIKKITVLQNNTELEYYKLGGFAEVPGMLWIKLPQQVCNKVCTVIKIELDGELDLYVGEGGGIKA